MISPIPGKARATKTADSRNHKAKRKNADGSAPPLAITRQKILKGFLSAYGKGGDDGARETFNKLFSRYLVQESEKHSCYEHYNVLILFDDTRIVDSDSDRIYRAVKTFPENGKPLLLILYSRGGEPGPAFLIGKLCREFCNKKLVAAVPRRAKSAATLIACAADEIHMGSLSQLGPIDPQFDSMPALGLKNSIEHIAELATKYKGAEVMFARYMALSIEPIQIGFYQRVAESAQQYAEMLLREHAKTLNSKSEDIAQILVEGYKDHGFVIDKTEATKIFGQKTILSDTPEYEYANRIYEILSELEYFSDLLKYQMYFIGSLTAYPVLNKVK